MFYFIIFSSHLLCKSVKVKEKYAFFHYTIKINEKEREREKKEREINAGNERRAAS